jgi:hypothetical protein
LHRLQGGNDISQSGRFAARATKLLHLGTIGVNGEAPAAETEGNKMEQRESQSSQGALVKEWLPGFVFFILTHWMKADGVGVVLGGCD